MNAASSLYSSGAEKIGHHSASSLYSFIERRCYRTRIETSWMVLDP
jgi:hypothetical protein